MPQKTNEDIVLNDLISQYTNAKTYDEQYPIGTAINNRIDELRRLAGEDVTPEPVAFPLAHTEEQATDGTTILSLFQ